MYAYLEKTHYNKNAVIISDGVKFTRLFNFPKVNVTTKVLAEKLTLYVKDFDELLNLYFNSLSGRGNVLEILEKKFIAQKRGALVI